MRYREITEKSVRMGARDLKVNTDGFLIGFEFEIAAPSFANGKNAYKSEESFKAVATYLQDHLPFSATIQAPKYKVGIGSPWSIVRDASIKPTGAELVSPPLPYQEALARLHDVLTAIDGHVLTTNESTGLHINVSVPNPDKIDLLKLVLLLGEGHLLKKWNREDSLHADSVMPERQKDGTMAEIISRLNDELNKGDHHSSIDFGKLKKGYLEFRISGGENYHQKEREITSLLNRYIKLIAIASDETAEREAYLTKLSKLFPMADKPTKWAPYGVTGNMAKKILGMADPEKLLDPNTFALHVSNLTNLPELEDWIKGAKTDEEKLLVRIYEKMRLREKVSAMETFSTIQALK